MFEPVDAPLEDRIRMFTVIIKVGIQTGQFKRGRIPSKAYQPSFRRICHEVFDLNDAHYAHCIYQARKLLEKISMGRGLTSDDLIRSMKKAA